MSDDLREKIHDIVDIFNNLFILSKDKYEADFHLENLKQKLESLVQSEKEQLQTKLSKYESDFHEKFLTKKELGNE